MSEEVATAIYDLLYWRRRCEQAEQRECVAAEAYNGQQQSYRELETLYQVSVERALRAEADAAALRAGIMRSMGDPSPKQLTVIHGHLVDLVRVDHPGAALLAELAAARNIVATLRRHMEFGGEVWGSIDRDFAAYDAAKVGQQ